MKRIICFTVPRKHFRKIPDIWPLSFLRLMQFPGEGRSLKFILCLLELKNLTLAYQANMKLLTQRSKF